MVSLIAKGLLVAGALMLVAAMLPTRQLIAQLPQGRVRSRWYAMLAFVWVFLVGYGAYGVAFWQSHERPVDLLVPTIFLLGAGFVWLNAVLSLQTLAALLRLSLLERENISDPLTGVYNRRYLDRRLHEETARARRHGLPLTVLMIDIDHYKRVNDQHGHLAGDQVLAKFADLVGRQLREPDILARYGGEEFLVIAPQTLRQDAISLAERLRATIGAHTFTLPAAQGQGESTKVRLTCSIGVASLGAQVDSSEMLVHHADQNLYRAKHGGRNRVNADEADTASP